ncbi:hypothetical protein U9M48_044737, partial [Paspalum notatum var. saurae]
MSTTSAPPGPTHRRAPRTRALEPWRIPSPARDGRRSRARPLACAHCHPAPPHLRLHATPISPSAPLSRRRPREARFTSLAPGHRSIRPPAVGVRASRFSSKRCWQGREGGQVPCGNFDLPFPWTKMVTQGILQRAASDILRAPRDLTMNNSRERIEVAVAVYHYLDTKRKLGEIKFSKLL